jgi:restriction endonuclease S subunit
VNRWKTMPLGDLTELVDYGVTASATEQPIGPKFLRITDIQNGAVNWATVPSCQSDNRTLSNARLKPGDIVFARTGATTGKSFLIRECPTDSVFASYLIRVRMGHSADPRFISHFFQTPNYWTQITSSACGVAQPGINATRLKALKIPLPPLAEQQRIAEVLDRVETLRSKRRAGLAQLDSLTQSLFLDLYRNTVDSSSTLPLSYLAETTRCSFVNGPFGSNLLTSELHEEGVPVIYIRDIRDGDYNRVSKSCVTERKARELAVYSVSVWRCVGSQSWRPSWNRSDLSRRRARWNCYTRRDSHSCFPPCRYTPIRCGVSQFFDWQVESSGHYNRCHTRPVLSERF